MTFLRVKRAEYRRCPWFNPHAADLIDSLLLVDPEKRLGAGGNYDALRAHPFFGAGWDTGIESVETAVDFAGLIGERNAANDDNGADGEDKVDDEEEGDGGVEEGTNVQVVVVGEGGGKVFSTLPPLTPDERWIATLVAAAESADLDVLKGKRPHVKGVAALSPRQRLLLQHMLSERKLLASPEIVRLFFESRDDAIFRRADRVERVFLGMSIYEEPKFTNAYSFVFLSVPRASRPGSRHEMLRRAVGAVNRLWPRPRFLVLCGENDVIASPSASDPAGGGGEGEDPFAAYKNALRLLAPNIAVISVPGRSDFSRNKGVPTAAGLEAYRSAFGADYFSFWIGRIQFIVLNSALMVAGASEMAPDMVDEAAKQAAWFEREAYVGRTRGTQVHVLCSNPAFLRRHDEREAEDGVAAGSGGSAASGKSSNLIFPPAVRARFLETMRFSWGKYIFSAHPTRNGRGVYKGSDTSYEECNVTSVTTASLLDTEMRRKECGPLVGEEEEEEEEEEREAGGGEGGGGGNKVWVGGLRVVRVFESFAKPDFYRVNEMPTKLDLDVVTNTGEHDSDDEAFVPAKAQASAAATWTPHARAPEAAAAAAMSAPSGEDDDDGDELVIEDVTGMR
jgi:hypothetical protein